MTHVIKFVGRTTDFKGKSLWEIVGNLKDFGVGRIVLRNMFQRYNEPTFLKILKVEAEPNDVPPKIQIFRWPNDFRDKDKLRKVKVTVEQVFRGVKAPEPVTILRTSYKTDYILIPKHLEKNYMALKDYKDKIEENIMPRDMEFPPLLKRFLVQDGVENPRMKIQYVTSKDSLYRVAEEGEKPSKNFEIGLGVPRSPNLYKNVKLNI